MTRRNSVAISDWSLWTVDSYFTSSGIRRKLFCRFLSFCLGIIMSSCSICTFSFCFPVTRFFVFCNVIICHKFNFI